MIDWDALNELDFFVYGILFHAGVRQRAKILDRRCNGRNKNGFLYLFSGEVEFFDADGNSMHKAAANDLIYIPKGLKYKLCYNEETHFALINFEMKSADEKDFAFLSEISTVIKSNTNTELISIFKTRVKIVCDNSGKGKISIPFKDEKEFERIKELLSKIATES